MTVSYGGYTKEALDKSYIWFQDASLRKLTSTPAVTREGQKAWFESLPDRRDYKIWSLLLDSEPIGAFGLKNIADNRAEYWGYIGDDENRGKGYGESMLVFSEREAADMGIDLIYLKVIFQNIRAINIYFKRGFTISSTYDSGYVMEKAIVS